MNHCPISHIPYLLPLANYIQNQLMTSPSDSDLTQTDTKNKPKVNSKTIPLKNAKQGGTFVSCRHNTDGRVIMGEYHYHKSQFPEVSQVNNSDQLIDN